MAVSTLIGIEKYDTPRKVDFIDWIEAHLDCDYIISDINDKDSLYIIAYATSKEYNAELYELSKNISNSKYMRGMASQEVNSID